MREIKFRGWNGDTKQMEYWDVFSEYDDHQYYHVMRCAPALMQYTGLKDKHGTEIYEGDVVHAYDLNFRGKPAELKGAVVFNGGRFCVLADGCYHQFALTCAPNIEVIGNIYENPELLK